MISKIIDYLLEWISYNRITHNSTALPNEQQSPSRTKSRQVQGQKLIPPLLLNLLFSLLLSILPHVMNLPPLLLLLAIPLNRRPDAAHSPLRAIRHPLPQILQLALRFGFLAAGVLLYAGLAQVLVAERVA